MNETDVMRIDFSKLPQYSWHQIDQILAGLPDAIYKMQLKSSEAEQAYDRVRQELKVEMAKAHLMARARKELTSNDDRKAWVAIQPNILQLENDLIKADGERTAARLGASRLENLFTAVRKIASKMIEEQKQTGGVYGENRPQ